MTQERAGHQPTNEQFFKPHDAIGLLMAFKDPDLIEAQASNMPSKFKDLLLEYLVVVGPELNGQHYQTISAALWCETSMREKPGVSGHLAKGAARAVPAAHDVPGQLPRSDVPS